jgi:hypothetical protein
MKCLGLRALFQIADLVALLPLAYRRRPGKSMRAAWQVSFST